MGKRRSKKKDPILYVLVSAILTVILTVIIKIILVIFNLVYYYKTDYKKKTGIGFFKMYFNKGLYGEFSFYRKLTKYIDKKYIHLNLYLDNINTDYTEIDIVAITKAGVYVFEVKNYAGWIYGNDKDRHWMQVFNKYTKHQFFNPVRQNYAHTKSLERYLGLEEEKFIPVVAFSMRSKLKKLSISNNNNVFNYNNAFSFVKSNEKKTNIFEQEEIEQLNDLLLSKTLVDEHIKQQHIDSVIEVHGN